MNDVKLIESVRQYPCLYDLSNAKYTDMGFKRRIWSKIGKDLKTTGSSCKTRWANIRDNFRKSLLKNITVSAQTSKTVRPYKYSEQLRFLMTFFDDRISMSNYDDEVRTQDYTSFHENIFESSFPPEIEETKTIITLEPLVTLSNTKDSAVCSTACPTVSPTACPTECPTRKKTKKSTSNLDLSESEAASIMEYIIKKNKKSSKQHPVDAFLSGLAPTLKNLPPRNWHYAKSDIFAAVQKYELKLINDEEQAGEQYPFLRSTLMNFQTASPCSSHTSNQTIPGQMREELVMKDIIKAEMESPHRESDQEGDTLYTDMDIPCSDV